MASNQSTEERLRNALADRYTIEAELGAGGMATVYLATDLKHDRQVAVKVLNPELAQSLGADRFLREIKTAANLTHPHILPLHDSGEADGFLYYVMPYMKGESLRARLTRERQLPVEDAVQITREIADALGHAHDAGVVHRDVKPANIMLEAGHAVLADFGVAQAVAEAKDERLTRTGTSLGTPAYMSPEQAGGERDLDGRSDQYALGCVLYEMLAGHPPFTGAQVESVVRQHLTEQPPSISKARPSVAQEVARVISRALSKSPADRFRTTGEMAAALALTTGPAQTRRRRSSRSLWMGLAAVAIMILAAGVYSLFFQGRGGTALPEGRVAVFPFENLTGDSSLDALGPIVAHWITDGLNRVEGVEVLHSNAVVQAVQGRSQGLTDLEIATGLGVGTLVSGLITTRGDSLDLSAQITEVSSGNVLSSVGAAGHPAQKMAVVDDLRARVMGSLAITLDDTPILSASDPPTYEAYEVFLRGRRSYFLADFQRCAELVSEATRLDPSLVSALLFEAACYDAMGRRVSVDSVMAILETRRDEMSPAERLGMDNMRAGFSGDTEEMLRTSRLMARENPYMSASLAAAAIYVGPRPEEALEALEVLGALPATNRVDGSFGVALGFIPVANLMLGRYQVALEWITQRPTAERETLWSRQLEIHCLIGLGRLEETGPLLDEIEGMEPGTGRFSGWFSGSSAVVFYNLSAVMARFGHTQRAQELADRAVTWYRNRDPERYKSALARALLLAEQPEEALDLLQQLVEEEPENLTTRQFLGIALALTGDAEGAEAQARWIEELESPSTRGFRLYSRAAILAHLNRKEEAVRLLRQALGEGRHHYYMRENRLLSYDPDFMPLWEYEPFEQLVEPKR